jgi:hypothetical protein
MSPSLSLRAWAAASRAGWPALAGAALLVLGALVYATGGAPALQRLQDVRQQAAALRPPLAPSATASAPAEQVARLRELFPAEADVARIAAKVIAAAQRHHLVARQVTYRFEDDKGLGLTRMHMALPLSGQYVAIRRFLIDVHDEIPSLALEQVQFERHAAGDRNVDARVQLRIHLGRP